MEVVDLLKEAYGAVEQANIPENLRVVAFAKTLDLLIAPTLLDQHNPHPGRGSVNLEHSKDKSEDVRAVSRIAAKLDIQDALADRIFDDHEDAITFCGDIALLGKSKVDKVSSLALLFIAARRWSDLDEGGVTKDELVRAEVDRVGLLDVSNYSKQIASLKPFITILGRG